MYIKKKVYLKNTKRASIKEITDFGMILRPYKLLVIAKVQDGDAPVTRGGHLYLKLDIIRVKKFT